MDGHRFIDPAWERRKRKRIRAAKMTPWKLDPMVQDLAFEEVQDSDWEPIHGYSWAVNQLRWGRKVVRGSGLRGGRKCFKSIHQAFDLASVDEMLATDWKLWRRPDA
jgi:hypothetical protein